MDSACKVEKMELSTTGVFALPGEPSIVINGLPPAQDDPVPFHFTSESDPCKTPVFGEWLVGREVRKLFGEQYYTGKVSEFDKEMGWYRVVYEDGDLEDLEWPELEQILQPLDITVPLNTVAAKIIRRNQRSNQKLKKIGPRGKENGKGKEKQIWSL